MDFDTLPDDAEGQASAGWQKLGQIAGNAVSGAYEQGGQEIHNALQQADQGNYAGLQNVAINNAAGTLGAQQGELTGVKAVVSDALGSGKSLPEIKAAVSDYINSHLAPMTEGPHGDQYKALSDMINAPPTAPLNLAENASLSTPKSLDQAILNAKVTNDPHHVQDFLAQKFSIAGADAPEDMDTKMLMDVFHNIASGDKF